MRYKTYKYWRVTTEKVPPGFNCVWIYCPVMDEGVASIKIKREIYQEFIGLEDDIKESNYQGWVACTDIYNLNVIIFAAKRCAIPFEINQKEGKIWFYKPLGKEG